MSKQRTMKDKIEEAVGGVLAYLIGWASCAMLIVGTYEIGLGLAQKIGWDGNKENFAILCAIAFAWTYERREASDRFDKIEALLTRLVDGRDYD